MAFNTETDRCIEKKDFLKISLETRRTNSQTNLVLLLCIFFWNVFWEVKRFCVGDVMGHLMTLWLYNGSVYGKKENTIVFVLRKNHFTNVVSRRNVIWKFYESATKLWKIADNPIITIVKEKINFFCSEKIYWGITIILLYLLLLHLRLCDIDVSI